MVNNYLTIISNIIMVRLLDPHFPMDMKGFFKGIYHIYIY